MSLYNIPNKRFFIFQSKSREHVCQLAGNKLVFKIIQKYKPSNMGKWSL